MSSATLPTIHFTGLDSVTLPSPKTEPEDPRVRLAGERTLLAWLRTGLAMMGFGFVVARFGLFLREIGAAHDPDLPPTPVLSLWIGASLIVLGVAVNIWAAADHARFLQRLNRGEPYQPSRWSGGIIVTILLAIIGAAMTVYLFTSVQ